MRVKGVYWMQPQGMFRHPVVYLGHTVYVQHSRNWLAFDCSGTIYAFRDEPTKLNPGSLASLYWVLPEYIESGDEIGRFNLSHPELAHESAYKIPWEDLKKEPDA